MKIQRTKKDIETKKARVVVLTKFIEDNHRFAAQSFATGYYTAAADKWRDFADKSDEISRLRSEIQQLAFELERMEGEQTELRLSPLGAYEHA